MYKLLPFSSKKVEKYIFKKEKVFSPGKQVVEDLNQFLS
jgi:hypothetical protein